ncbi:MAG TPA: c-type cytochrome domain-containing protein, partial [Prosthecobacter sp.]|nr:c-type cytochrome domain-containing protein [Prosthecobacter sp.]
MLQKSSLNLLVLLCTTAAVSAADPDFYRDVYPFLKANCISCHNKTTTKADLNMETPEDMKKGGESGPGIIPGKGAESLIVLASLHKNDLEMPPENNKSGAVSLTPGEVELLKAWIDLGAKSSAQQERQVAWQPLAPGVHPIYCVAMTRDGRYAACGRSNEIFVYDLATRQHLAKITDPAEKAGGAHRALVQSLAFSPDGTRLASGSFREVKIWRLEQTKTAASGTPSKPADAASLKRIAEGSKISIISHAVSGDGKQVVTGGADGTVRVWDATTAKSLIELRGSVATQRKMAGLEWTIAAQGLEQAFHKTEVTRIEGQNKA